MRGLDTFLPHWHLEVSEYDPEIPQKTFKRLKLLYQTNQHLTKLDHSNIDPRT